MNNGIIGATVYAYKHKDYGDVFLCLKDSSKYTYFDVVGTPYEQWFGKMLVLSYL